MNDVRWIKLTTSMFDNEKIKLIESLPAGDSILIVWIKLLTLAGKTNEGGYIYLKKDIPYTNEMLSSLFNRKLNIIVLALKTFEEFSMIERDESNRIFIPNWGKHQNEEGLGKIREQGRLRQKAFREKQKLVTLCNVTPPVTAPLCNGTEEEVDKETELKRKNKKDNVPPSLNEISNYCVERKNGIDPQKFFDHYEANGWMRGKTKIKSWKACVRTWEGNQKQTETRPQQYVAYREDDDLC